MREVYLIFLDLLSGVFHLLYIPTQFEIDFGQNILEFLQLILLGLLDVEIFLIIWVGILFLLSIPVTRVFVVIVIYKLK